MSLIVVKIVAMCLLGILKLGSGLLPIFLVRVLHFRKSSTMDTFMGIILCVGGGVLISTVFVHMIPEVRESLAHAASLGYMPDSHYAFAELIICLGFFLVFGIEAVVQRFVGGHGHSHGVSAEDPNTKSITSPRDRMELRQGMDNGGFEQENPNGHTKVVSGSETGIVGTPKGRSPFVQNSKTKSFQASGNVYNVSSATLTSYMSYSDGDSMDTSLPSYMPRPNHKTPMTTLESLANEKNILVTIRNFLIVIALSIHSVFEGMAIGLQMTEGDVWKLFTAVSIHSWAILFCIGMDMIVQGTKRLHIIFNIVILALTTPLGIVLGILVTEHVDESSGLQTLVIGILQGVAAGTLLYISFYEVLEKEKLAKAGMTGLLGFFFIFFGFSIMAGLQAIGGHSHGEAMSEDHGHNHGGHAEPQGGHPDHHADHQKEPLDDVDQNVKEALSRNDHFQGHGHSHGDHGNGDHGHSHGAHSDEDHGHSHGAHGDHDHHHSHGGDVPDAELTKDRAGNLQQQPDNLQETAKPREHSDLDHLHGDLAHADHNHAHGDHDHDHGKTIHGAENTHGDGDHTHIPENHTNTYEDHDHAHENHNHGSDEHPREDHNHAHGDHNHGPEDHGHGVEDQDHAHGDHNHVPKDHGHGVEDQDHAHGDHNHGPEDHAHGVEDHHHAHGDHNHGFEADHNEGHDHADHKHEHEDWDQEPSHEQRHNKVDGPGTFREQRHLNGTTHISINSVVAKNQTFEDPQGHEMLETSHEDHKSAKDDHTENLHRDEDDHRS